MTIITKPLSEKKEDKIILPLVDHDQLATAPPADVESLNGDPAAYVILRARARRISTMTTMCLLLTALLVVCVGVLGGTYLYKQYLRSQVFKGWCAIPYENNDAETARFVRTHPDYETNFLDQLNNNYFNEQFELDLENEDYEKIDVPDFKDGRNGRFIHDFNTNITGIIDITGRRCFVMPLDRSNVLPPKSLFDMIRKMWDGYYKVNTEVVRKTMKVITPPIDNEEEIGNYISTECSGLPIYKLEQYVGGITKRSADLHDSAKFAEFSGMAISEWNIINLEDVLKSEQNH